MSGNFKMFSRKNVFIVVVLFFCRLFLTFKVGSSHLGLFYSTFCTVLSCILNHFIIIIIIIITSLFIIVDDDDDNNTTLINSILIYSSMLYFSKKRIERYYIKLCQYTVTCKLANAKIN